MRWTVGRPAPRSSRVNGYGANSFTLAALAMHPANDRPSPYKARPATRSAVGSGERRISAARSMIACDGMGAVGMTGIFPAAPPSLQAASAGMINVAILPGGVRAATIASVVSRPISFAVREVLNQWEYGLAIA